MTDIGNNAFAGIEGLTIYGYRGSAAETYAKKNNITFVSLGRAAFSDVKSSDWFYNAVMYANFQGLITGYGNSDMFGPEDLLTRAQAAVILCRYFSPSTADRTEYNATGFADVEDKAYYTAAANWAVSNGLIKGIDGSFVPNGTITRDQLCVILARAAEKFNNAQITSLNTVKFDSMPDAAQVQDWARTSIIWALNAGVINGSAEDGIAYIRPEGSVTRAVMATIMMNAIENDVI